MVHTQSDIIKSSKSARSNKHTTTTTRTDSAQKPPAFESNKIQRVQFNRHTNRTKRLSDAFPLSSNHRARGHRKKKIYPSGKKGRKSLSATTYRSLQQLVVVLAGASDDVGSFGDGRLGDDNLRPEKSGLGECRHYYSIPLCVYKSKAYLSRS